MHVREFLAPAAVFGEHDTLAEAMPALMLNNPVFVRGGETWRRLLPQDVVGYPRTRLLIDCPLQVVVPVSVEDDIEVVFDADQGDIVPAQEGDLLVGQVDRREILEELRILEGGDPMRTTALLLSRTASPLVHDLSNVLTALQIALTRQDEGVVDLPAADAALAHASRLINYFQRIVAHDDEPEAAAIAVDEVVEGVLELLRSVCGTRITIEVELGTGLPPVRVSRRLIERVLLNLVLNARDAIRDHDGVVRIETSFDDDFVVLRVIDDGPGIPAALVDRVFEPGVSSKATAGRGVGLSGIARALHRVGSRISLEPRDVGTCFRIELRP